MQLIYIYIDLIWSPNSLLSLNLTPAQIAPMKPTEIKDNQSGDNMKQPEMNARTKWDQGDPWNLMQRKNRNQATTFEQTMKNDEKSMKEQQTPQRCKLKTMEQTRETKWTIVEKAIEKPVKTKARAIRRRNKNTEPI